MIKKIFTDKFKAKLEEALKTQNLNMGEILKLRKSTLMYYPFITGKGFQDVREVFEQSKLDDTTLIAYYQSSYLIKGVYWDKIRNLARAVNARINYKHDSLNWGKTEYWAKPIEVHEKRSDDCDGYSVLITKLLRLLGLSKWEVFTAVGPVYHKTGKREYHAYTIVLDRDSLLFYPVEGSFYPRDNQRELEDISTMKPLITHPRYGIPDWITNDMHSFSRLPWRFIK